MKSIKFGSESKYIKLEIPSLFSTEDWAQISVEIRVDCFAGTIAPWINSSDIEQFTVDLQRVYDTLTGQAVFTPLEEQLTLKVEIQAGGKVSLSGFACSDGTYENRLEFVFELDQTYLQSPLKALEMLCVEIKAQG